MITNLDEKAIKKNNLSICEVYLLLAVHTEDNLIEGITRLKSLGLLADKYINKHLDGYFIPDKGINILNDIIIASNDKASNDGMLDRLNTLVPELQDIFPKGKKEGTAHYWRGNKSDIKKKLQSFLLKYGDNYTDDQILKAATEYVKGFNGQYRYMRLLQYFIWKEEVKDGTKVTVSILADYLENEGDGYEFNDNWTSEINLLRWRAYLTGPSRNLLREEREF